MKTSDPLRHELARLAAQIRLSWWSELGALRFSSSPRSGDEADGELVRLEALGSRPPLTTLQKDDPQLEELAARLEEKRKLCAQHRKADHPV